MNDTTPITIKLTNRTQPRPADWDGVARQLSAALGDAFSIGKVSGYWLIYRNGQLLTQRRGRLENAVAHALGRPIQVSQA